MISFALISCAWHLEISRLTVVVQKSADYGQNWRFLRVVVQIFTDYRHCPIAQRRGEGGILHGRPSPHNMVGEKFLGKVPRLFFHFPLCCNRRAQKTEGHRSRTDTPMQSGCAGLAKPEGDVPGSVSFPDTLPSGVAADR